MQHCRATLIFINRPHYMFRFGHECSEVVYCKDFNVFESHGVTDIYSMCWLWNFQGIWKSWPHLLPGMWKSWQAVRALWGKCAVLSWKVFLATWLPRGAPATVRLSRESFEALESWGKRCWCTHSLRQAGKCCFFHYNKIVDMNIAITKDSYSS